MSGYHRSEWSVDARLTRGDDPEDAFVVHDDCIGGSTDWKRSITTDRATGRGV